MTDDEAILAMTDDNLRHREKILPMEKAQSLKMQVEAISHQGTKMEGVAAGDVGKRSTEIVGERNGMNYKQVQRYIRLTELVPELQSMVNEKKLSFTPAVEISFIKPKNQRFIAVSIEGEQASPSLSQAQELRKLDIALPFVPISMVQINHFPRLRDVPGMSGIQGGGLFQGFIFLFHVPFSFPGPGAVAPGGLFSIQNVAAEVLVFRGVLIEPSVESFRVAPFDFIHQPATDRRNFGAVHVFGEVPQVTELIQAISFHHF